MAAILGVRHRVSYEGQAAVELEWLATDVPPDGSYPVELVERSGDGSGGSPWVADLRPAIREILSEMSRQVNRRRIARRFHSTVASLIAGVCGRIRGRSGVSQVVLSGGVFLNALLTEEVLERLGEEGFRVYRHRLVPPNDGGLSLGQIAVAAFGGCNQTTRL